MGCFYITNEDNLVIEYGFSSESEAQDYIFMHGSRIADWRDWWHYDVKEWPQETAYGVVIKRNCYETNGVAFAIFETWDEAADFVCEQFRLPFNDLPEDFNFDDDIFQIDMSVKEH